MTARSKLIIAAVAALAGVGIVAARARQSAVDHPVAPIHSAAVGPAWFEDRAASAGVNFRLGHGGKSPLTVLEEMGTGCAVCDLDGDGHADIFLVGEPGTPSAGRCALYRNKGDGTFEDVTKGS